jgi:hypothetical protein
MESPDFSAQTGIETEKPIKNAPMLQANLYLLYF